MQLSVCSRKKEELYLKACYIIDGQTANFFIKNILRISNQRIIY